MDRHLVEISEAVAPGAHAALVLDGSSWHVSDKLVVSDGISPVKLPPYAPNSIPSRRYGPTSGV